MPEIAPKELFSNLVKSVAGLLKPLGFTKRGNSFRRRTDNCIAVIEFQSSRQSTASCLVFTINLGIVAERLLDADSIPSDQIAAMDSHLSRRIGFLMDANSDHWWRVASKDDAAKAQEEIMEVLEHKAIPFLANHQSEEALRAHWESGKSYGLTDGQRLRHMKRLLSLPSN